MNGEESSVSSTGNMAEQETVLFNQHMFYSNTLKKKKRET